MASPARTGSDRRQNRRAGLNRARSADPVPDQSPVPDRPGHRRTTAPLRTPPSRLTDPRRCTKFGNIPEGGGRRFVGRQQGKKNKICSVPRTGRTEKGNRRSGTAFVHTVIDDHSRVAYAEICTDEKADTASGVLERAARWFVERGVTVERVLSDHGACYRSHTWRDTCTALAIAHKRTRLTGHRPTARSNDFTAPSPTAGPTPGSTNQPSIATQPYPPGSTSTITTEPTPPSAVAHQSPR